MGLIEMASGNSVWRGMDYYKNKKVIAWEKSKRKSLFVQMRNWRIEKYEPMYIKKHKAILL